MAKKKTGTKEWAETNVNLQLGCENGCRYCYARYDAVVFRKWCTAEQWLDPVIVQSKVTRSYLKRSGVVMLPSTHDVTPRNLLEVICVLRKLLEAGNEVLLVSKPRLDCITTICEHYRGYRKQLHFRFTIGSMLQPILSFWEPGAPGFFERLECLIYAHSEGFKTSVSCEPFLDFEISRITNLYHAVESFITDSFWIGKLRHFEQRVFLDIVTAEDEERFVKPLKAALSDGVIWAIYHQLQNKKLVRWKDSIREVIEKGQQTLDGTDFWRQSDEH